MALFRTRLTNKIRILSYITRVRYIFNHTSVIYTISANKLVNKFTHIERESKFDESLVT